MGKLNNPSKTFKTLLKSCSTDETRPILSCVYLAENGDAVSTDSYRLTIVHDAWSGGESPIIVPNDVVRGLAKAKASVKTAEVEVIADGEMVKATLPDGTEFADELPYGKYPNYTQLMGGKVNTIAYLKPKELLPIVREHLKLKQNVRVEVADRDLRMHGIGEEPLPEYRAEKACDGADNEIGFDPRFLRDALSVVGKDCELRIENHNRAAVIAAEDVEILIMPVRIAATKSTPKPTKPKPKPMERKAPSPATKSDLERALYRIALDRAASDPDGRVQGGNASAYDRNLVFEYERSGQLTHEELGDLTSWYVDGEFVTCIERRWSKRKIHLTYPELKPFKHKADLVASRKVEQVAPVKVEATVTEHADVTAIEIKPTKKEEPNMEDRIKELEAQLKATREELETVWKENETLKRKPEPKVEPKPEPEPKADMPEVVTLETMQTWCEGRGLLATQKRPGTCIWVEGESKPYAEELKAMGLRFAKKRKSWYFAPTEG